MFPSTGARSVTGRVGSSAGSATVELAAAIPLLVAVTVAMVAILGLARDQLLAQGAAREALPPGRAATITVADAAPDRIRVSVSLPVALPFGAHPLAVSATAVAAREPGAPPDTAGRAP